ncbi:DUF1295 domain-containing protein [Marilutibacter maris]|uniref:Membrane protein n=1 Tax=Marilutibacter maris TaxID=1605891 RepID=A0A2U9T508_9GAMM|nr:DUF1295 domain-containing protein [Lysobacter maris]AWV06682.1 membrane protein [Lysobacter maris]
MNPIHALAVIGSLAMAAMSVGWWWQRRHANAGIVDVLWAACVGANAVLLAIIGDGAWQARVALAVLGGSWGLRLSLHLWRRVRDEPEDGRYRHLRAHWHGHQGKFYLFFVGQAVLVVMFSLPFAAVARSPVAGFWPWIALAVAIGAASVVGEAIADRQLARFRASAGRSDRVCDQGLWRYSRHPNYFFEWLHWFAYAALAVGSPWAWLAWSGPLVMYLFLRWISGIPYTEAQALRTRGESYREYQRRTPMLIPWFPRSPASVRSEEARR